MNSSIVVSEGYYGLCDDNGRDLQIVRDYLSPENSIIEYRQNLSLEYSPALPPELDVFSELPDRVNENNDVRLFLGILKNCILRYDRTIIGGVSLSKLHETEHSESVIVIEWIYNYFRVFFGFEKGGDDFYGRVYCNNENGEYSSNVFKMDKNDYGNVAQSNLDFIINAINGII